MRSDDVLGTFHLTAHALQRMTSREVSCDEVMCVILSPEGVDHANTPTLVHYRARIGGRQIQVTIDALTDEVVTVVAVPRTASGSAFGWFTLGAALDEKSNAAY